MAALSKQENFAVNTNKSQVYIEDGTTPLSYNFKTDQWSTITDYAGIGFYSVESGINIGLARVSGSAVDLQQPNLTNVASEAVITTGESTFSDGSRRIITGVRPLLTANDAYVSIKYRSTLNPGTTSENYLLRSEDISHAAWTAANATILTDQVANPVDGLTTADKFSGDGVAGGTTITQDTQALIGANVDFVVSAYAKYAEHAFIEIRVDGGNPNFAVSRYDIQTGTTAGYAGTAGVLLGRGIEALSGGWFRCWVALTNMNDTTPTIKPRLMLEGGADYVGTDGLYLFGLQVDDVDALSAYVKSDGTMGTAAISTSEESTVNSRSGVAPFRIESRYHRVKLRVPGGFTTILGADVEYEQSGEI